MIRGLYTSATGMIVQRQKMDVVTTNIVNAETTGYKSDELMIRTFDSVMLERLNDPNVEKLGGDIGTYSFGNYAQERITNFDIGAFETTGRNTDIAIDGDGFFVIEMENGEERYTRCGNFVVDPEGYLTTERGNYVLGENGRILVGSEGFSVSLNGAITPEEGLGIPDTLRMVSFEDNNVLRKEGHNLYYIYGDAEPVAGMRGSIRQGIQESSNVNIADESVDLIQLYRKYEANQRAVRLNDETLGLAVNKLGTL